MIVEGDSVENNLKLRKAERVAYCRVCDEEIPRGADMVSWYSHRNTGQHIHICVPCVKKLGDLVVFKEAEYPKNIVVTKGYLDDLEDDRNFLEHLTKRGVQLWEGFNGAWREYMKDMMNRMADEKYTCN